MKLRTWFWLKTNNKWKRRWRRNAEGQRGGGDKRKTNDRLTETDKKFADIKVIYR